MAVLAALLLIAFFPVLGWPVAQRCCEPTSSVGWRIVISSLAGLVASHLILLGSSLLGLRWQPVWLLPTLLLAALAAWLGRRPRPVGQPSSPARLDWGEAIAALALVSYAVYAVALLSLHPDFIFHWGIKGHKLYLAQGVDFTYLTRPWNNHLHPDYPLLLPMLFALTALFGAGFDEAAMMLWSVFFFLLSLLALRELLLRLRPSRAAVGTAQATVAVVAAMFGVGYLQAGGADWMIVLAVMAAMVPLLAGTGDRSDVQIAFIAGFAAAAKIEGAPLAVFLLVLHLERRWRSSRSGHERWRSLSRALPLPVLVIGLWAWTAWAHDLFLASNTGDFRWSRATVLLPALFASLLTVNWHAFSFSLLALPFLAFAREWRGGALLCLLQLLFYLYIYMSAPVDTRLYVQTSGARLFFHLIPAVLTMLIVASDRWANKSSQRGEQAARQIVE